MRPDGRRRYSPPAFCAAAMTTGITLVGNAGANALTGGAGADTLVGAAGNDVLTGGAGADTMDGGEGSDIYVIAALTDTTGDVIADTGLVGTDELRFTGAVAGTLVVLAGMMQANPDLMEIDINPLCVRPAGQGVEALDALLVFSG